jgi:hypothetical protein
MRIPKATVINTQITMMNIIICMVAIIIQTTNVIAMNAWMIMTYMTIRAKAATRLARVINNYQIDIIFLYFEYDKQKII